MANENDEVYDKDNAATIEGPTLCKRVGRTSAQDEDVTALAVVATHNDATVAVEEGACVYGKMNDLVADLCANNNSANANRPQGLGPSYGDCTNIRATSGPALHIEGAPKLESVPSDIQLSATTTVTATQPHNSTSTFSFKHFLNSANSAVIAPSTTVTSLDAVGVTASTVGCTTATSNASALQTSTGARPKVPQSSSVSGQSISSLAQGPPNDFGGSVTKMKRSPRFSSFDSQASLAEYAGAGGHQRIGSGYDEDSLFVGAGSGAPQFVGPSSSSGFRLYPDALGRDNSDFLFGKLGNECNSQTDRHAVPRSVSNYEMPAPPVSPRRRIGAGGGGGAASREPRPTRLALNTSGNKLKLDLRLDAAGAGALSIRAAASHAGEFPAAAALPDFVQDHWLDSWYAHDMHLNSQPGSPISDFFEDFSGGPMSGTAMSLGPPNDCVRDGGMRAATSAAPLGEAAPNEASSSGSKMLPDFLSDGPIIHSSQRLADVTVGLPSNSASSPEEPTMASQLSLLRIENERLQRQLEDARVALCEQTRRADDYERQLQAGAAMEPHKPQSFHYRHSSLATGDGEARADERQRRAGPTSTATTTQSHVSKLKQQVLQLTTEVERLRRENELLHEDGAFGGWSATSIGGAGAACSSSTTTTGHTTTANTTNCDRNFATAAAATPRDTARRPSKAKEISRGLLRAASNAELNLKQLLAGVDNLRQMAADIDSSETDSVKAEFDEDPDLFNDFPDSCHYDE